LIDEDEDVVVDGCGAAGVDGVMSGMYEKEERKTRTARGKKIKGSERDDAAWVVMEGRKGKRTTDNKFLGKPLDKYPAGVFCHIGKI